MHQGQFLVRLELYGGGNLCGAADADLEKFFRFFPFFECSKRHPTSVVIHQIVVIVKITQVVINLRDGDLEHREGHIKVPCSDASLKRFEFSHIDRPESEKPTAIKMGWIGVKCDGLGGKRETR